MSSIEIYKTFDLIVNYQRVQMIAEEKDKYFCEFNKTVEYCLNCLKNDYSEIINKSFFAKNYEFWWMEVYSESTYYRKRLRAIVAFVNLFNLLDETFINNTFIYNNT